MIKALHIISALDAGGVETQLYNILTHTSDMQFDFVVHGDKRGKLEAQAEARGCRVVHVTPKRVSLCRNFREIDAVIRDGAYDAVFVHQNYSSGSALLSAARHRVPVKIAYARGAIKNEGFVTRLKHALYRVPVLLFSDYRWAISMDAGRWLYGKRWKQDDRNIVFLDSFDTEKFRFSAQIRMEMREKLGVAEKRVLLMVGRFSPEKNHKLAIDVLRTLADERYVLLFVGNGDLEAAMRQYAADLGERVRFLGTTARPQDYMCAADILLFPSLHEGFGDVAVEAQLCGLPVLASDRIPTETAASPLIRYLPIDAGCASWVEAVRETDGERADYTAEIENKGFSLDRQALQFNALVRTYVTGGK